MESWSTELRQDHGGQPAARRVRQRIQAIGDRQLLKTKWIAFFCSVRCPGGLVLKSYDLAQRFRAENVPVIGGFHSPVEREVLRILLRSKTPVCVVLARSLPKRIRPEFRRPLEAGRLLLLAPFDERTKRASLETAEKRNRVVANLAQRIFVAYAGWNSKTEAFCREMADSDKPCLTFDEATTANLRDMGFEVSDRRGER